MKRILSMLLAVMMVLSTVSFALPSAVNVTDAAVELSAETTNTDNAELLAMGDYGGNITGATWYWPIHGYSSTKNAYKTITSSYGFRGESDGEVYNEYHRGVDIAVSRGTLLYPVRSGTVYDVSNSTVGNTGRYIIINHGDGYYSVYMHLNRVDVSKNDYVTPSNCIGTTGGSGFGSESGYPQHLHLGIHYGSCWDWECSVNPCPSGYEQIGKSLQTGNGGFTVGKATISYSVNLCSNCAKAGTKNFSYTGDGVCTSCGTAYNYAATETTSGITTGIYKRSGSNYGNLYFRTTPYDNNNSILTSKPSEIEILSVVTNADGGRWYKIKAAGTEQGYLFVVAYKIDADYTFKGYGNSEITINPTSYPTGTIQAAPFSLKGTITSKYNIKSVEGKIINSSTGSTVTSAIDYPNTTSYNISGSKIDSSIKFGSLSNGTYRLVYTVTDITGNSSSKGNPKVWESPVFSVGTTHPQTYTVAYNANGGTGNTSSQTKTHGVDLTLRYGDYTKTGYVFSGWNTKADGTGTSYSRGGTYTANQSITLYAKWTPAQYGVYYDANGGSGSMNKTIHTYNVSKALSKNTYTREGYIFKGWAKTSSGSVEFSDGETVKNLLTENGSNMTLYAVWEPKTYTVTYNANGGTGAPSSGTKTHDKTLYLSYTIPTRYGYEFTGWNTKANGTGTHYGHGYAYKENKSVTLYAQWEAKTYYIEYYATGGENEPAAQIKIHDEPIILTSEIPTRYGYTFVEWNTDPYGSGVPYYPNETIFENENLSLYAIWVKGGIAVESVDIDCDYAFFHNVGETIPVYATVYPVNATNKAVTWKSSNSNVATVFDGVITAKGAGTATITVTTEDGKKTDTCIVTVTLETISVTKVKLNKTSATLTAGEKLSLIATVTPSNATNKDVTWKSSNEKVATVENGVVTAKSKGTATITVITESGSKKATCKITVKDKPIAVSSVSLSKTVVELNSGEKLTLKATVYPSNAENKDVTWTSSNTKVATVSKGKVTAKAEGTATITVTTEDGRKTATCKVTVLPKPVAVKKVALNQTKATMYEGDKLELKATVTPTNATNKDVTWKSSNEKVATVENGVVTAKSKGTATITVITESGSKKATCKITVKDKPIAVSSVSLSETVVELNTGKKLTLKATVYPSNAENKDVIWTSSNTKVATVSKGKVTAKAEGTATITVTTEDGRKTATCRVTVLPKPVAVKKVALNQTKATMYEGDKLELVATVTPSNATNKDVTWKSSNEKVAIVEDGLVIAISKGRATITATSESGSKKATCKITVK